MPKKPETIENTALLFLAAVYGNPEFGPGAVEAIPSADRLPEPCRPFYQALLDNGLAEAKLNFPAIELAIYGDKFAKKVRDSGAYHLIQSGAISHAQFDDYARRLRNWSGNIRLSSLLTANADLLNKSERDVGETAAEIITQVEAVASAGAMGTSTMEDVAIEVIEQIGRWHQGEVREYISTNIKKLDEVVGGYPRGEITVVAANTSGGKTAYMVDQLRRWAQAAGKSAGAMVVFSAEMSKAKLGTRIGCNMAMVSSRDLRSGRLDKDDPKWNKMYTTMGGQVKDFNLIIDETPDPSWEYMFSVLKRVDAQIGLAGYWLDYAEKVNLPMRVQDETLRMSMVIEGQKKLAKILDVPGIILSQYSRKATADSNFGKKPRNDWLKATSKMEQEAANIIHVHWPKYFTDRGCDMPYPYDERPGEIVDERAMFLVVTKGRDDSIGMVRMHFDERYGRFTRPQG